MAAYTLHSALSHPDLFRLLAFQLLLCVLWVVGDPSVVIHLMIKETKLVTDLCGANVFANAVGLAPCFLFWLQALFIHSSHGSFQGIATKHITLSLYMQVMYYGPYPLLCCCGLNFQHKVGIHLAKSLWLLSSVQWLVSSRCLYSLAQKSGSRWDTQATNHNNLFESKKEGSQGTHENSGEVHNNESLVNEREVENEIDNANGLIPHNPNDDLLTKPILWSLGVASRACRGGGQSCLKTFFG